MKRCRCDSDIWKICQISVFIAVTLSIGGNMSYFISRLLCYVGLFLPAL